MWSEDEPVECFNCPEDGIIFLYSDGWICEACYRMLGNVPAGVGDELHDHINANDERAEEWRINIQAQVDGYDDPDITGIELVDA